MPMLTSAVGLAEGETDGPFEGDKEGALVITGAMVVGESDGLLLGPAEGDRVGLGVDGCTDGC